MNAALARIILRYIVGGVIVGSTAVGEQLAADPDLVMACAAVVGVAIEGFYVVAKRKGWSL